MSSLSFSLKSEQIQAGPMRESRSASIRAVLIHNQDDGVPVFPHHPGHVSRPFSQGDTFRATALQPLQPPSRVCLPSRGR